MKNPLKRLFKELKQTTFGCFCFNKDDYKRQNLPACRPLITFQTIFPTFLLTSLLLLIIGVCFWCITVWDQTFSIDYTDCIPLTGTRSCAQILDDWRDNLQGRWPPPQCICWYKFYLNNKIQSNAYVYYGLKNYYQNHLHYVRSKDFQQFQGYPSLNHDCEPFRYKSVRRINPFTGNITWDRQGIVPCGTRANSLFNDTYTLWFIEQHNRTILKVPLSRINIAWPVDKSFATTIDPEVFRDYTNPPYWGNKTIWDLDRNNPDNNGLQNEALIVWMRVSAFPTFRKLYARIVHKKTFQYSLPNGQYYLRIDYNYPVKEFHGRKYFILANTNRYLGGPYFFLSIIYLIVGGLCLIWAILIYAIHKRFSLKLDELIDIDERTTPYLFHTKLELEKIKRRRYELQRQRTKEIFYDPNQIEEKINNWRRT